MFGSGLGFVMGGSAAVASQWGPSSQEGTTAAAAGAAAAGRRADDRQPCLPTTVRLVLEAAAQQDGSGELRIHGAEVNHVVLVGVVEGLSRQSASVEFTLNDSSGRVAVRHYVTGDAPNGLDALQEGRYACVTGGIRTSPAVHVSALRLRPVVAADEVSYHLVEAAHAALRLRRAGARAAGGAGPATPGPVPRVEEPAAAGSETPFTPEKVARTAAAAPPLPVAAPPAVSCGPAGAAPDLGRRVAAALRSGAEGREEGLGLGALLAGLTPPAPEADVRRALQQLVEAGEIYTTIDDDHFACL